MGVETILTAVAGATAGAYANRKSNERNRHARRTEFSDRMKMAEQYGIHPLQMLGSAGTAMGTGGANLGSLVHDERKTRRIMQEQRRQEARQDEQAMLQRAHEIDLANINVAPQNMRNQLLIDQAGRQPTNIVEDASHAAAKLKTYAGDPLYEEAEGWFENLYNRMNQYRTNR